MMGRKELAAFCDDRGMPLPPIRALPPDGAWPPSYHGKVDGIMGPETKKALNAFQHKHHLTETGVPDAATLDKLRAEHAH